MRRRAGAKAGASALQSACVGGRQLREQMFGAVCEPFDHGAERMGVVAVEPRSSQRAGVRIEAHILGFGQDGGIQKPAFCVRQLKRQARENHDAARFQNIGGMARAGRGQVGAFQFEDFGHFAS